MRLIEWVKSTPTLLVGFLTLTGAIITFVFSVREYPYLIAVILVILLALFNLILFTYIYFSKKLSPNQDGTYIYRFKKKYRRLVFIWNLVVAISIILLFAKQPTRIFLINVFRGIPIVQAHVIIAKFDSHAVSKTFLVSRRLITDLKDRLKAHGLNDITVKTIANSLDEDTVKIMGKERTIKAIVWGWYDDSGIEVHIFLGGDQQLESSRVNRTSTKRVPWRLLGESDAQIDLTVKEVLPNNVSFLSLFIIGHLYYMENEYLLGRQAFDAAMEEMPKNVQLKNNALVQFFLA